ncbi:MAG: heparinase II/III family protein, partial [Ruminiclostridium sp.]|nr:heparinase II/III family protein [Ruminiclostridium sp.]
MKKQILCILVMLVMVIVIMPCTAFAETASYGTFTDGSRVISDVIRESGQYAHPRIIMTDEKFQDLISHIDDGSVTAILLQELRSEADRIVRETTPSEYDAYGDDHLHETSKRIQRHVAALALAYNIFGDKKYADHCYEELKAACSFPDWSPKHFLDTAEMCTAFAYGYDWLYNWMTPEQRTLLRTNMIEKGLSQVMQDYTDTPADRTRTYKWYQDQEGDNWQLVCTGGTNLAALAIGDEEDAKDISSKVLSYGYKRAYSFVRRSYSVTDGTYIEGLGYWDYATYYLGLQSSALKSAAGTDYGLADYEGIRKSAEFVRYMSSNIPTSFSFGDDRDSRDTGWAVFLWLGEQLNSPELSAVRLKKIDSDPEFNYLDVLWIDESKQTGMETDRNTDWGAVGASNASFRDSWNKSGLVAALHVGENNYKYHGHYDLGSFYIESNGARFFTDLGNENYELEDRQYSYRIKAEGHNTLVINPTDGIDQREGANCLITAFRSGNEAYAVTDLTDAYAPSGAASVIRGLKMIKDKGCVVVQDEISLKASGDIYWFAHTKGQIKLASDKKSAVVTVGSDKMWVGIIGDNGKFTVMNAEPLPTSLSISGQTDNKEYRKLAIHLTNTKDTTISVACIKLKYGETKPSWTPSVKAISDWASQSSGNETTPVSISGAAISSIADQTYTGSAVTPDITVKDGSKTLIKNTDYTLSYNNNINAGTATVTATGKGNYTGTKTATFNIVARNISNAAISSIANQTYTGSALTPAVTVKDDSRTLVSGTDYTVSYSSNINVGNVTVTVTGKGNYKGTKTAAFAIVARNISNAAISSIANQTYTGSAVAPAVTVKDGSKTLTKNTDYTISYSNNTNVGTAKVTITGKNNYTGTKTATFNIVANDFTVSSIGNQTYTGSAVTPDITVKDGSRTLTSGTDYTVSYSNNTNVGTAKVTITGKGKYTGTKTVTFKIVAKNISGSTISSIADQTYTGSALTPAVTVKEGSITLTSVTDYTVSY